jgi:double-stranded uracil-DNA glycosylase
MSADILPDLLAPGLRVVFCGTAAGPVSARVGAYYAGPGNRFWPALAEAGFTPRRLRPPDYPELLRYGIGLTDLVKTASGADSVLRPEAFDLPRFRAAMLRFRPQAIAFTSRTAANHVLPQLRGWRGWGACEAAPPELPPIFVLPSPSGRNGHWVRQDGQSAWTAAAAALGFHRAVAA